MDTSKHTSAREIAIRFARASLLYFVVVGVVGVFLRARYVTPLWPELQFANLIHAHSHVAYFGWTSLAIMAVMYATLPKLTGRPLQGLPLIRWQLILSHIVNIGALISFSIGGYTPISIVFSTVNVLLWYVFMRIYWLNVARLARPLPVALRYWHGAIFLLLVSSLGTWLVSAMTASGGPAVLHQAGINIFLTNFTDGWLILGLMGAAVAWLSPGPAASPGPDPRLASDQWARGPLLWIVILTPFTFLTELVTFELPSIVLVLGLVSRYVLAVPYVWFLFNVRGAYRAARERGTISMGGGGHPFAVAAFIFFAIKAAIHFLLGIVAAVPSRHMFVAYLHLDLLGFVSCGLIAVLFFVFVPKDGREKDGWTMAARSGALVLSLGLITMVITLALVAIIGGSRDGAVRAAVNDLLQAAFLFGAIAFVGVVMAVTGLWNRLRVE